MTNNFRKKVVMQVSFHNFKSIQLKNLSHELAILTIFKVFNPLDAVLQSFSFTVSSSEILHDIRSFSHENFVIGLSRLQLFLSSANELVEKADFTILKKIE